MVGELDMPVREKSICRQTSGVFYCTLFEWKYSQIKKKNTQQLRPTFRTKAACELTECPKGVPEKKRSRES